MAVKVDRVARPALVALIFSLLQTQLCCVEADASSTTAGPAAKVAYTLVNLWNQPKYTNKPKTLKAAAVFFNKGTACVTIPKAYQLKVLSFKVFWRFAGPNGGQRRSCNKIIFYTQARCTGFSIGFVKPAAAVTTFTPSMPGVYANKVVSMGCRA